MNSSVKNFARSGYLATCLGLMLAQAAGAEKTHIEITRPAQAQQTYTQVTTVAPAQQRLMVLPTQQRFVVLEQPAVVENTRTQKIQKDTIKIPVVFMGEGSNPIYLCAPPGAKPYPRSGW